MKLILAFFGFLSLEAACRLFCRKQGRLCFCIGVLALCRAGASMTVKNRELYRLPMGKIQRLPVYLRPTH